MTDADYEQLSAFSCGIDELDNFFHHEVKECVDHRYLAAFTVYVESGEIVGAFTLMNDALMIVSHDEKEDFLDDLRLETDSDIADFLNRQSSYPAINIGHLGISKAYQCRGIGSAIIDFVADTFLKYRQSGCQFITVDALNDTRTLRFYSKNLFGFQTNSDMLSQTRRMYRFL